MSEIQLKPPAEDKRVVAESSRGIDVLDMEGRVDSR
jgi:hypothetical protein